MAIRMGLGQCNNDQLTDILHAVVAEYNDIGSFNTWIKKHYGAIEIHSWEAQNAVGGYRVYEFPNKESYTSFILKWL